MNEIASLIARSEKYLHSAQLLLDEEDYESCVSRAYYSMFYAAEAVLLSKNLTFSSHKSVIAAFGEHFILTNIFPRELGRELNRAFEKRQLGDYEYTFIISKQEADLLLERAVLYVETLTSYLKKESLIE
ncbi:HEPN domain-containing protein [Deltaproteobacteria bacterium TL4]